MKTYTLEVSLSNQEFVKATLADGRELWIPTDPTNSDYAEYLRYTAWVEAGNDPQDFWTQETE